MKKLIVIMILPLIAAAEAVWCQKFAGVTHEDIGKVVTRAE